MIKYRFCQHFSAKLFNTKEIIFLLSRHIVEQLKSYTLKLSVDFSYVIIQSKRNFLNSEDIPNTSEKLREFSRMFRCLDNYYICSMKLSSVNQTLLALRNNN
ncbi:hypothetical protein RF11_11465 [Thelohanellus kitauei]|uniref:Uncharacterized protein n=1 Tax=Thelohanellus kitauei TaxID=669202 RepID=A0A0C2N8H3_THEKT|nr:hypothetical protein RF11_11465 [Thelohanellus kitauei]